MNNAVCPSCGAKMKRNGRTGAGAQRWRCVSCGASSVHGNNTDARELKAFLGWLLSRARQCDMAGGGRTFRRRASRFWRIWPMPEVVDEVHRVVYVDGIYLARNLVVLIACSDGHVLSWYMARAETKRAWKALLSRIAPPDMVVTDGGSGFAAAAREEWPGTKVQRCLFHAFCTVRKFTTSRPNLQAGKEIYGLARDLMHVETLRQADLWVERFLQWCDFWNDFLNERTWADGRWSYTHERLVRARRSLVTLINDGTLFTYLDPGLCSEGPMPRTNNVIEGGVNAQLREMVRNHRGMSEMRRVKAVFWWCYMHTECPKGAPEILATMPTDDDIDFLYEAYASNPKEADGPVRWGDGLVWSEMHHATRYPYAID